MTTETVSAVVLEQLTPAATMAPAPTSPPAQTSPTPAPTPAPTETPTALAAKDPSTEAAKTPATYPEDWRERAAKGDAKKLAKLSRYASPEAMADALIAANDKISSGGLKTPAPEDAEALSRWRADNGIPESPEKYDIKLKDGLVLGELDKPLMEDFLKTAHTKNVSPEVVNEFANWYFGKQEQAMQEFAVHEASARQDAEKALISEWGNNYTVEKNNINNFLKAQGLEDLQYARMPDGTSVGNSPDMLRKLAFLAKEINPGATVVPGASNASATIDQEIAAIEKTHGTETYTKDKAKQDRYMELLTAREKINSRK